MKTRKLLSLIATFILAYLAIPSTTRLFAASIKNTPLWTTSLGYSNGYYNTKGFSNNPRELKHLAGFFATSNDGKNSNRVFCIEPGATFFDNATYNFEVYDSLSTEQNKNLNWSMTKLKEQEIRKIMSCWYAASELKKNQGMNESDSEKMNAANVVAAQALVWEIVTGERSQIAASKILKDGVYKPDNEVSNSLYSQLMDRGATKTAYQSILRCASRYENGGTDGIPSWASSVTSKAPLHEMVYDANTKSYWLTAKNKASVETQQYFKYFKFYINNTEIQCGKDSKAVNGITCRYDGVNLKFTTNKVIPKEDPVRITFKYSYKDDKKTELFDSNDMPNKYYLKSGYQSLISGSFPLQYYINIYSSLNKYQFKVTKVDENNNPIKEKGVSFNLYKGSCVGNNKKDPVKLETDANGVITYQNLEEAGKYCLEEIKAPNGYVKAPDTDITVSTSNKVGTTSYATKNIVNTKNVLSMIKRTIRNGQEVDLDGDYCVVKTCPNKGDVENGPEFSLTSNGKKVCVVEVSNNSEDGKAIYNFSELSENCPSGTTDKIKTCKGKFDIKGVPEGDYKVVEEKASCDFELPELEARTQIINIKRGENPPVVTMYNGVSGIVFNKKNENGVLLDGGKFTLQRKESGVYRDVLLRNSEGIEYVYSKELTEETGTYLLETTNGTLNVTQLPVGDYRFVEKEAPQGYAAIKDKDSTATFTISDAQAKSDSYQNIVLVNRKTNVEGSSDSAELIVTIITGRRVINYVLIITSLIALLIILILLRRKYKK